MSTSRDSGRVSVFLAIGLLAAFMVVGLSVDGAGQLFARQRAYSLAAEAARTGGQTIDEGVAIDGGAKVLREGQAEADALAYLSAAGATGTAETGPDLRSITVRAVVSYEPVMLGVFGWDESIEIEGAATAVLLDRPPA